MVRFLAFSDDEGVLQRNQKSSPDPHDPELLGDIHERHAGLQAARQMHGHAVEWPHVSLEPLRKPRSARV
jgi:hypothetical protein